MERREQIKYIKTLESDFLNKVEGLVQTKYLNFLFDKYKKSVQEISECYKNPNTNLSESAQCAKITMEKYFDKEKRFETLLHHYEVNKFIL